jgi:DNA-binding MarR family transcriptional regulator
VTSEVTQAGNESIPTTRDIIRAARMISSAIERELAAEDLTVDEWLVLAALSDTPGLTMARLRAETLTPAPTLTRIVDRLAARAVVFREVDGVDRRKVRVSLSKRGVKLHSRLSPAIRNVEQSWFIEHGVSQ